MSWRKVSTAHPENYVKVMTSQLAQNRKRIPRGLKPAGMRKTKVFIGATKVVLLLMPSKLGGVSASKAYLTRAVPNTSPTSYDPLSASQPNDANGMLDNTASSPPAPLRRAAGRKAQTRHALGRMLSGCPLPAAPVRKWTGLGLLRKANLSRERSSEVQAASVYNESRLYTAEGPHGRGRRRSSDR